MLIAVSTEAATAYVVVLYVLLIFAPAAVTLLKGQYLLFVAGLLTVGLVWMIVALRLARPDSWWARRNYDERKLARARERYGG